MLIQIQISRRKTPHTNAHSHVTTPCAHRPRSEKTENEKKQHRRLKMLTHWQWFIFIPTSIVPGRTARCLQQKATLFRMKSYTRIFHWKWFWCFMAVARHAYRRTRAYVFFSTFHRQNENVLNYSHVEPFEEAASVPALKSSSRAHSIYQSFVGIIPIRAVMKIFMLFRGISSRHSRCYFGVRLAYTFSESEMVFAQQATSERKSHVSNWPHRAVEEIQRSKWNSNSKQFSKIFSILSVCWCLMNNPNTKRIPFLTDWMCWFDSKIV